MSKNFVVVTLPNGNISEYIDIPKCAFFSDIEAAKEYIEQIVFDETGDHALIPGKSSDIHIQLPDKVLELWVCYMPVHDFLN